MYLCVIVGKSHKASKSLCCLPPWPTTQADNLCGRRQLPLIARQGSVEAGLKSNGSSTGTPSKPRKNLIKTVAGCLLLCPPLAVWKHLKDSNVQNDHARKRSRVGHMTRYLCKQDSDREHVEFWSSCDAFPDMSDSFKSVKQKRWN